MGIERKCAECGNTIETTKRSRKDQKFCSNSCRAEAWRKGNIRRIKKKRARRPRTEGVLRCAYKGCAQLFLPNAPGQHHCVGHREFDTPSKRTGTEARATKKKLTARERKTLERCRRVLYEAAATYYGQEAHAA